MHSTQNFVIIILKIFEYGFRQSAGNLRQKEHIMLVISQEHKKIK